MSILAVYDCMILLAQASRPERTHETFELLRDKTVSLCMSPEVLAEVADVLNRPEYRRKFPNLTDDAVATFLRELAALAHSIEIVPLLYTLDRDPKDSKYINLALAAGARHLVTRDKDLLDLMDETTPSGKEFRQRFPDLRILEPRDFVREIERSGRG